MYFQENPCKTFSVIVFHTALPMTHDVSYGQQEYSLAVVPHLPQSFERKKPANILSPCVGLTVSLFRSIRSIFRSIRAKAQIVFVGLQIFLLRVNFVFYLIYSSGVYTIYESTDE